MTTMLWLSVDTTTIRTQLATARAALHTTQDDYDRIKAITEQAVMTQAGGPTQLGTNSEDRERALRLALEADPAYVGIRHTSGVASRGRPPPSLRRR